MNVTLLSTGGTITDGGRKPTRSGAELLEAVPELESHADLSVEEVARVPSFEMDAETLETIGERVRELDSEQSVDAVIITHGTDTIEETAYYLDVTIHPETPVFLTGAQRRPDEVSSDGPSNLLTAIRAAKAFVNRDADGTFVAFNEEIHSARAVTKAHTSALEAFRSRNTGPVATVDRGGIAIHRPPRSETRPIDATSLEATVFTVKSGSAVTGELVDAALKHDVDGLVVEGTGLGNATAGVADAIRKAIESDVPVVVVSRCLEGRVAPLYGGDGGGKRLRKYGTVFAGDLSPQQARLRLTLTLEAVDEDDAEAIRKTFASTDHSWAGDSRTLPGQFTRGLIKRNRSDSRTLTDRL